jgi:DNA topoisomerase III
MGKGLITTEKYSVAKEFADVYGGRRVSKGSKGEAYFECDDYLIINCVGHMFRQIMPEEYTKDWKEMKPRLLAPDEFRKDFNPHVKNQTNLMLELIKRKDVEYIINAGDAGREGEGIQREVYDYAFSELGYEKPIKRFWTSEVLSTDVIRAEMNNLKDNNDFHNLYDACLARERSDWIIGMSGTGTMTSLFGGFKQKPLSIGRVQTSILALIVRRENEILNFKEKEYFNITASLDDFKAKCIAPESEEGDKYAFWDKAEATNVLNKCTPNQYLVEDVQTEAKKEYPKSLFSMPDIQIHMGRKFSWTPTKSLEVAQSLYEKKWQTYPRTDSRKIGEAKKNDEFVKSRANPAAEFLELGDEMVSKMTSVMVTGKRIFDNNGLTDHHAIIPAEKKDRSCSFDKLNNDEQIMFKEVAKRFILCFHPPVEKELTTATLTNSDETFLATGTVYKDISFKKYDGSKVSSKELTVRKGALLDLETTIDSIFTKAPSRFSEGDVVEAMSKAWLYVSKDTPKDIFDILKETKGIGTGATRDGYVPILIKRDYVVKDKKIVRPTDRGMSLIALINDEPICDFANTALMEHELKLIEDGNSSLGLNGYIDKTKTDTQTFIDFAVNAKANNKNISESAGGGKVFGKCQCSGDIEDRGPVLVCSNCNAAVFKEMASVKLNKTDIKKIFDGEKVYINGFKSKSGKSFGANVVLMEKEKDDGTTQKVGNFDFTEEVMDDLGTCACGGAIKQDRIKHKCENCHSIVYKVMAQAKISDDNALKLFHNETIFLDNFKSKSNKKFGAKVRIQEKETYDKDKNLIMEKIANFDFTPDESEISCSQCHNKFSDSGVVLKCETCNYTIFKEICKKRLTDSELERILGGERVIVTGLKSKANKFFDAPLLFRNNKIEFDFQENESMGGTDTDFVCDCGGEVSDIKIGFKCKKCEAIVFKKTIGKKLSDKNVSDLFAGKQIHVKGFKSKAGNSFDADLVMDFDKKKTELIFEER